MKNLRVAIFVIIILVITVFIGTAVRSWYRFMKEPVSPLINALPINTSVIIKSNSVFKLLKTIDNSSILDLFGNKEGNYFKINSILDSVAIKNKYLYDLLESNDVVISFIDKNEAQYGLLLATSIGKTSPGSINKQIKSLLNEKYIVSKANDALYKIEHDNQRSWYYIKKGILAFSNDSLILARSLQSLTSDSNLSADSSFLKLFATGGKRVDANIMINNKALASSIWPDKSSNLKKGTPFDQWTTFDINIKKSEVLMGGFTLTQSEHYFKEQQPVEIDQFSILPPNTALAISLSLSDQDSYIKHFLKGDTLQVKGYDASIKQDSKEVFTPKNHIRSWIGNTVSLIYTNDYFRGDRSEQMILISSRDNDSASYYLKPFIEPINDTLGVLHYNSFTYDLWGNVFKLPGRLYCLITGKSVAISPGRDLLERYAKRGYSETNNFKVDREIAGSSSNLFIYLKPEIVVKWFAGTKKITNRDLLNFLSRNNSIGLQYSAGNELQYTHAWMIPDTKHHVELAQVTETKDVDKLVKENILPEKEKSKNINNKDTAGKSNNKTIKKTGGLFLKRDRANDNDKDEFKKEIALKSKIFSIQVLAGYKKNEKQIALLSENGQLSMYDYQGKLLWNFKASGPPSSKIMEVDYHKNGKIHYLVATKQKLHIIDQKGDEVKDSPIKLPATASGEISIFDYDKKKDYRLLYTATNNQIYNITLKGLELPDWQKPKVTGNGSISFQRTNGKDYLIYKYNGESVRIFDRRGRERIKVDDQFSFSSRSSLYENKTNSKGIFITLSKTGELTYINKDGVISKSTFGRFDNNPWFCYYDYDNDGSMDFIFAGKDRLIAYNKMKEVITSKSLPNAMFGTPFIYSSSSKDTWIFVRNTKNKEIFGLHNSGKIWTDKSIKSDTDPIVFNPGGSVKEVLITTSKGKLVLTSLDRL